MQILYTSPNCLNVSITMFSPKLKVSIYTPLYAVIHADEKERYIGNMATNEVNEPSYCIGDIYIQCHQIPPGFQIFTKHVYIA